MSLFVVGTHELVKSTLRNRKLIIEPLALVFESTHVDQCADGIFNESNRSIVCAGELILVLSASYDTALPNISSTYSIRLFVGGMFGRIGCTVCLIRTCVLGDRLCSVRVFWCI